MHAYTQSQPTPFNRRLTLTNPGRAHLAPPPDRQPATHWPHSTHHTRDPEGERRRRGERGGEELRDVHRQKHSHSLREPGGRRRAGKSIPAQSSIDDEPILPSSKEGADAEGDRRGEPQEACLPSKERRRSQRAVASGIVASGSREGTSPIHGARGARRQRRRERQIGESIQRLREQAPTAGRAHRGTKVELTSRRRQSQQKERSALHEKPGPAEAAQHGAARTGREPRGAQSLRADGHSTASRKRKTRERLRNRPSDFLREKRESSAR